MTRLDALLEEQQHRHAKMLQAKARLDATPLIEDDPKSLTTWRSAFAAWDDRNQQYLAARHALHTAAMASRAAS